MTPLKLQEDLAKEIQNIFTDDRFDNSLGERVTLNVFEQQLPVIQSEDDEDPFPYAIVRLETGKTTSQQEPNEVDVTIIFGIVNQNKDNEGHKDVLNLIQKVYEHFEKEPILVNQYRFQEPFQWALQDEESFPYFFGAVSMTFQTTAIRRENPYT